ncbi:MAG: AAA family ATPase [Leptolyngbyaceae cyanobacterium SM2_5_2]|nr:AAA family ATPase [Leptolyngbyaceae cyanobacterium SM2_5_2]
MVRPLIILAGIPGSGKSTWANQFIQVNPRYRVVSTDQCRATLYGNEATQGHWSQVWSQVLVGWQRGLEAIAQGQLDGLIYDATNTSRRQRCAAIAAARQLGFSPITLYWFDVPLELALSRNQNRSRQVPAEVIERMHRQLQGAPPAQADGAEGVIHLSLADLPYQVARLGSQPG